METLGEQLAENRGVTPPDLETAVGRVRVFLGDTVWEEYIPPQPGFGLYRLYSDHELEVFLEQAGGAVEGAMYLIFLQMSSAAAMESKSVRDLDLQVDLTKRAGDLRAAAALWKDRWDEVTGAADIFELFDTVTDRGSGCAPEASPYPYPWGRYRGGFIL